MTPILIKSAVESAFAALLAPFAAQDLKGWQIVARWFGMRPKAPRISLLCGNVKTESRTEDGTPTLLSCAAQVLIASQIDSTPTEDHEGVCASVAGILAAGADTVGALNDAMTGQAFTALRWEPLEDVEDVAEAPDKERHTTFTGTLYFVPWQVAATA